MVVLELVQNVALLLALVVGYDLVSERWNPASHVGGVVQGVLFGVIAIIGMMTPVVFAPGVVYDGRSVVLAAAGFIGGPVVATTAAIAAGTYRWVLGGAGVLPGVFTVLTAAFLGVLWHQLRKTDARWRTIPALWGLGLAVHVVMLLLQLLLPDRLGFEAIRRVGLPILVVYPIALVVTLSMLLRRQDRISALERLRERESQYRALFENRHAPMLVIDPDDSRIVDANPAAVEFYGWSRDELCRMRVSDLNTMDPEEIHAEMDRARRAETTRFEFTHRRRDGSVRDVAVTSGSVEIDGQQRLYSIIEDITERKRQARALFLADYSIENAAIAAYRINESDGRIVYANRHMCESLGYSREELLRMTIEELDPTYDRTEWTDTIGEIAARTRVTFKTSHRRKNGSIVPVEVTVAYFTYDGTQYSVSFAQDISERNAFEEQLRRSLEENQVLLREVHHRVRNNLAVITSLVSLQITAAAPSDDRLDVAALEKTKDRIAVMATIHDILYQTRDLARIDFAAFLRTIAAQLQAEYGRPGVSLDVDADHHLMDVTEAVPLGILVSEAVTNAFKHAFPESRDGTITIGLNDRHPGYRVRVIDNGVGFSTSPEPDEGTALGTELMRSLARQIDGELFVETEVNDGCTVTFVKNR
ncbi:MAG: PAS domain S-box protein [Alkalispirochaeta sp.]